MVCSPSAVVPNATSQCNAAVQGTGTYSSAVTWSASEGTISASGLINAPASPVTVTVTATSVQDTSQSGAATATVKLQTLPNQPYRPRDGRKPELCNRGRQYRRLAQSQQLMSNGALATNYYANSHPSIGNYFMLTTGQLLTADDSSTVVWNADNLARRMLASGVSFKIYAEGITQGYLGGNTGLYLIRHNPFAMLSDVADNPQVANQCIWPFTQFAADLASGTLPDF